jgi:predicted ribosome quality control (RQC) complex YloA/Tae2 family protein
LSLLPIGTTLKQKNNPIDAANEFFYSFTNLSARAVEKNKLSSQLASKIQANKNYIIKNKGRLDELLATHSYKAWADLIMANLHSIPPNSKRVELNNFYNDNIPTEIKLRPELTPQKNAEAYYRKSKNQQIEIDKLNEGIRSKEKEILALENQLAEIEQTDDLKKLKNFSSKFLTKQVDKKTSPLPYREYVFKNYKIWVGRDAQRNDELTLKFSFKEDLWLHAKDVSGSHVLIKHQAGKNFPKDVIEYAAQLAAFHSKRKTETLCPVAYTPKKFVRKRKGDPAGLVVVEREEVIMVEPLKPTL